MVNHRTYDPNAYSHLRRSLQHIALRWTTENNQFECYGWEETDPRGYFCRFNCFAIKNLKLFGSDCSTGILDEKDLKEQFDDYIYHHLFFITHISRCRPSEDPYTQLIIDEYGIEKYDDIELIKLSPKQIEERYKIDTEVFCCNSNVQYYIPKNKADLPIKYIIRIKKSIKLFPTSNTPPGKLHDWGIGKVFCDLNSDEDFYFRMTKFSQNDKMRNMTACLVICHSVDFGGYDINTTNAENDIKKRYLNYSFHIRYKQYRQEEGSILHSNAWHAPINYLTWKMEIISSELRKKIKEILIIKDNEEKKKKEIEVEK